MFNTHNVNDLIAKLTAARDAYYNNAPVMSDAAFDLLEDELRQLDPTNAFFSKVGAPAPASGAWQKVKHAIPMGSLNKVQIESEMASWVGSTGCHSMVVTEKLDGLSVCLTYQDRKLVQGLTRGDGSTGEDITRNVVLMQGAVKVLPPTLPSGSPMPSVVYVRGEIICKKSDHKAHFPGESNPRNTASGTAKRQTDNAKCQYLTILAYQFLPNGVPLAAKTGELFTLKLLGFQVPNWSVHSTGLGSIQGVYNQYVAAKRAALEYEIDGLVIDIDSANTRETLGELNSRPRGSVAYKFPHEEKETILRDIRWQVGNSGRITPVALFDSVVLGGVNVEKASLATARFVTELKLFPGCRILVTRRNDVIPRIEANLDEGISNN